MPTGRPPRLAGHDYTSPGPYFLTLVTKHRRPVFGRIIGGRMQESEAGTMVRRVWPELSSHYRGVEPDAFVVMPDHVHGILWLTGGELPTGGTRPVGAIVSLQDAVHRFKSLTTNRYMRGVRSSGWVSVGRRLWQDGFYERIVRSPAALERIRRYIVTNPERG